MRSTWPHSLLPQQNPTCSLYKSLRNAGKAPKLALIALARKLLVILTAVLRDKTAFVPSSKIQLPACAGMTMRQAPRLRQP
jgi:transposase